MIEYIITIFAVIVVLASLVFDYIFYQSNKNKLEEEQRKLEEERKIFQEEQESITNEFCNEIKSLDSELSDYIREIQAKNTVQFECPCEHQLITMTVDLSKGRNENIYTCPECGNEYYLNISLVPTLKENIVDEKMMYNLLSEKYNKIKQNESID